MKHILNMTQHFFKGMKQNILKFCAKIILGNAILEKILCSLCSNKFIRNKLKLGSIPFACVAALDRPENRVATLGTQKIWVNICEYVGMSLYFFKEHSEPFSAQLVSDLISERDTCVDIGANMGIYTFLMASKVGSQGRVIAFEPNPDLHLLLSKSIGLNECGNFVFLDSRALYSESGKKLKFYLSENLRNSGHSSLVNHGVCISKNNFLEIETLTLDDYFALDDRIKIVKIDVERAEFEVIKGMHNLLISNRIIYIILEQNAGSESEEILSSLGYQCWLIDEEEKVLVARKEVEIDRMANYLFVNPCCVNQFKNRYVNLLRDS